jgi:hypothetical protein
MTTVRELEIVAHKRANSSNLRQACLRQATISRRTGIGFFAQDWTVPFNSRAMKSWIAIVVATALTIGQVAAAHLQRARQHDIEHRGGGPYDSLTQGHQAYRNPDRIPYVTQFDEPAQ